jgi:hypothetical protein
MRVGRFSIVAIAFLWLTAMLPSSLNAARGGGKTEVLPVETMAPVAVVIETAGSEVELRKQLRAKNSVAELSAASLPFSQAPTGSLGFIAPQQLGMALVTQSPDLMIQRVAPGPNAFEVHKLADGSGMLVGFIGKDLAPQLTPANRPHTVRIALYSTASEKAVHRGSPSGETDGGPNAGEGGPQEVRQRRHV